MCQIVAEIFGITLDDVVMHASDSAVTPPSGRTAATRTLYMTGNATKQAAEAIRSRLAERVAAEFGVRPDEVDMADGNVLTAANPGVSMSLAHLAKICASENIRRSELVMFRAHLSDWLDPETGQGQPIPTIRTAHMQPRCPSISKPVRFAY